MSGSEFRTRPDSKNPRKSRRVDPKQETRRLLKWLRFLIQLSEHNQSAIERLAGFSRGYLSQILNGHVDIKLRHLLLILDAIEIYPADLFFQLYPRKANRLREAMEGFSRGSQNFEKSVILDLARLYGSGIESLEDLEQRLERCEDVLTELTALEALERKS